MCMRLWNLFRWLLSTSKWHPTEVITYLYNMVIGSLRKKHYSVLINFTHKDHVTLNLVLTCVIRKEDVTDHSSNTLYNSKTDMSKGTSIYTLLPAKVTYTTKSLKVTFGLTVKRIHHAFIIHQIYQYIK
jgi:hypothetical protein